MEIVQLLKALADETRIRILNLLNPGELCVCDIEEILNIQQSNASRHLNKLKVSGLIGSEKKSQWVYYHINNDCIAKYPFIADILNEELCQNDVCRRDMKRLEQHKSNGESCEKR